MLEPGPRGYFRSECRVGGDRVNDSTERDSNLFLALSHERRV